MLHSEEDLTIVHVVFDAASAWSRRIARAPPRVTLLFAACWLLPATYTDAGCNSLISFRTLRPLQLSISPPHLPKLLWFKRELRTQSS